MSRQRLRTYYSDEFIPVFGPVRSLLERSNLFVASDYATVNILQSLKWTLADCGGPACVKDVFIVIESRPKSFSLLQFRVRSFFLPRPFGEVPLETEEISIFCQNMDVEVHIVVLLAEAHLCRSSLVVLDKVWGVGRLYIFSMTSFRRYVRVYIRARLEDRSPLIICRFGDGR